MRYKDRYEAGRSLAKELEKYRDRDDVMVLALPRGGVPVGYVVAKALAAPLDVFVVRKLGVPGQEEYAMGAIASGGVSVLNREVVRILGIGQETIDQVSARELRELKRREREYRGDRPDLDVSGKTVIVVDDGLATGATMRAAVKALKRMDPARVVVAVPVGAPETCADLEQQADEVVCPLKPEAFTAVGSWFLDFSQTSDKEVRDLLSRQTR